MPAYIVLHQCKVCSAGWRHVVTASGVVLLGGTQQKNSFLAQQRQQDWCSQLVCLLVSNYICISFSKCFLWTYCIRSNNFYARFLISVLLFGTTKLLNLIIIKASVPYSVLLCFSRNTDLKKKNLWRILSEIYMLEGLLYAVFFFLVSFL